MLLGKREGVNFGQKGRQTSQGEKPGPPSAQFYWTYSQKEGSIMKTPIVDRDLTKQPPHSPRERFGGFAILARTVDKCRASIAGNLGEYHFDCPLDNQLFSFKGINGDQFKAAVASCQNYEDAAAWLQQTGVPKSPGEIMAWSDQVEAVRLKDIPTLQEPDRKKEVTESCRKLGLEFEEATLFEWLETDDEASFQPQPQMAEH